MGGAAGGRPLAPKSTGGGSVGAAGGGGWRTEGPAAGWVPESAVAEQGSPSSAARAAKRLRVVRPRMPLPGDGLPGRPEGASSDAGCSSWTPGTPIGRVPPRPGGVAAGMAGMLLLAGGGAALAPPSPAPGGAGCPGGADGGGRGEGERSSSDSRTTRMDLRTGGSTCPSPAAGAGPAMAVGVVSWVPPGPVGCGGRPLSASGGTAAAEGCPDGAPAPPPPPSPHCPLPVSTPGTAPLAAVGEPTEGAGGPEAGAPRPGLGAWPGATP